MSQPFKTQILRFFLVFEVSDQNMAEPPTKLKYHQITVQFAHFGRKSTPLKVVTSSLIKVIAQLKAPQVRNFGDCL